VIMLLRLVISFLKYFKARNSIKREDINYIDKFNARDYCVRRYEGVRHNWQAGTLLIFAYSGFILTSIGIILFIHRMHDETFVVCSTVMRVSTEIILNAAKFHFGFE
jgi:hypothetical protein